jgi:magnesium transporter
MEVTDTDDSISFVTSVKVNAKRVLSKAKVIGFFLDLIVPYKSVTRLASLTWSYLQSACSMSFGLGESTISASSVLAMPMVSSRTTGFRGIGNDRPKYVPLRTTDWSNL